MTPQHLSKRRFPRFPIQLPVLFRRQGEGDGPRAGLGRSRDLSEGGLCLEFDYAYPPGTTLALAIRGAGTSIEAAARVVWTGVASPSGAIPHGMQFVHLAPEQYDALRQLFPRSGAIRRGAVRVPVELAVWCQPCDGDEPPLMGRTVDLSRTGAQVVLDRALPIRSEVELSLAIPHGDIQQRAQVQWVQPSEAGGVHHGLHFLEPNWDAETFLAPLLPDHPPAPP
ncbi:MAG: PilZ domain-containing protein [Candidatus Methylomirabilales bacterium]